MAWSFAISAYILILLWSWLKFQSPARDVVVVPPLAIHHQVLTINGWHSIPPDQHLQMCEAEETVPGQQQAHIWGHTTGHWQASSTGALHCTTQQARVYSRGYLSNIHPQETSTNLQSTPHSAWGYSLHQTGGLLNLFFFPSTCILRSLKTAYVHWLALFTVLWSHTLFFLFCRSWTLGTTPS